MDAASWINARRIVTVPCVYVIRHQHSRHVMPLSSCLDGLSRVGEGDCFATVSTTHATLGVVYNQLEIGVTRGSKSLGRFM